MSIGFDLRPALRKNSRRRGVGKFTHRQLAALLEFRTPSDLVVYTQGEDDLEFAGRVATRSLPHLARPARLNWLLDRWSLARAARNDRLGLLHATEVISQPQRAECPVCVTIHDMIPLIFWEETCRHVPWDFQRALQSSYRKATQATHVLTISESAKRDIEKHLSIPGQRIDVIYPGAGPQFRPLDSRTQGLEHLKAKYGVNSPFLFYVGGTDFRKNLQGLLRVFARLRQHGYRGRLVLAGETFLWSIPETTQLLKLTEELSIQEHVVFPGYVPNSDIALFYGLCDLFVFPSLYEGFGLPVLEALKCGAAAAISRSSSLPEVAGDAAVYFDPRSEESMFETLRGVLEDSRLGQKLRSAGPQRAAAFSWRRAGKQLDALYQRLLSS